MASRTNKGLVRENNEDSVLVKLPNLFAIADGMGGYRGGEIASATAVRCLAEADFSGIAEESILAYLREVFLSANNKILALSKQEVKLSGMGTTLTAVYLLPNERACAAHVGDTRIYLLQRTGLNKVTSDHSYVAELVRTKEISSEEAAEHKHKNLIMRAVGVEPDLEVDLFEFITSGAEKILISSDGLTNMVAEKTIETILQNNETSKAADLLLEQALAAGGKDNISFIILDLEA